VATAATFSAVAYPEMRRYKYPQSFATGVIAAGGTLGAMFPPSTVLAVYGIITEQDIGKLFIAGILPGLLAVAMYVATIFLIGWLKPGFLPAGDPAGTAERSAAVRGIWAPLALFVFVIGGLYGGLFTPTEAGGMGAGGAFLIGVLRGRLSGEGIRASLLQATRTAAAVFTVLIGALLFGYFLTITQTPQKVTAFTLGLDPIWFGVIIVMTVELGLIHPPVGMNVFVIKSVVKDVDFLTIFKGVLPFILTDLVRLLILIAFPVIALWLPTRM
jgi:tripartite ATP-independent transporter DctM subunit